jgi:hypothetical protein
MAGYLISIPKFTVRAVIIKDDNCLRRTASEKNFKKNSFRPGNYLNFLLLNFIFTSLFILFICNPVLAKTAPFLKIPANKTEVENTFVTAWNLFRFNMDTLAHGNVHPALFKIWIKESPSFLLKDILHFAQEPRVLLASASELLKRDKKSHAALIKQIVNRYKKSHKDFFGGFEFEALLILSNDKNALKQAIYYTKSKNRSLRLKGGSILAAAGNKAGFYTLKKLLPRCDNISDRAALVLGRFGKTKDQKAIERALNLNCPARNAFKAASGEISFKKFLPLHYSMLLRRDSENSRFAVSNGLYETWMEVARSAFKADIKRADQLYQYIKDYHPDTSKQMDPEIIRRRLKEFLNFLDGVTQFIKSTEPEPEWPETFNSAVSYLKTEATGDFTAAKAFKKNVSAAIAICSSLYNRLNHLRYDSQKVRYTILTPRASDIKDGNFNTAWKAVKGGKLIIRWQKSQNIKEIAISSFCSNKTDGQLEKIAIWPDKAETKIKKFNILTDNFYYQTFWVNFKNITSITIKLVKIKGNGPGCINELRFFN